ncbi:MAG: GspE/PulE family protein [bacterium]|nr:GspE/PulE family protein [bacterium]
MPQDVSSTPPAPKVISGTQVSFSVLKYIPEDSARHYGMVPLDVVDDVLKVGMLELDNIEARDALGFITSQNGLAFSIVQISQKEFDDILTGYQGLRGAVGQALTQLGADVANIELTPDDKEDDTARGESAQDLNRILTKGVGKLDKLKDTEIVEEAPVTKIVAVIIQHATEGNASDVHIEPVGDQVRVRFRVDGVLHTSLFLPFRVHEAIVARIKILTNMKLDEKRKPQDGRFSARIEKRKVDFRVSTMPSFYGEKVVIRILDREKGVLPLEGLGIKGAHAEMIERAINRPYGLILITGPTGSGKTTTLYSILNTLEREKRNVVSLEDPIEYNIPGVSQSQVRPEIGYTFSNGLRSILRQDPDIIMVGEIRDKETAQLAIQAALTGHLVLSTLHTNNAIGVIPRLIDMGIDPYLIAPTLTLTIAQRLVQRICDDAKDPMPVEGAIAATIDKEFKGLPQEVVSAIQIPKEVYRAKPSPTCATGTRGRVAAIEMFEASKELEKVILSDANEQEIYKVVRSQGMITMREDALQKAFEGLIPFGEISRL